MSVVVGIKDGGRVVLAADSRVMFGDLPLATASPKLGRIGPYVVGVCGDSTVLDAVFHLFVPPDPPKDDEASSFMVCSFIPAYRDLLRENSLLAHDDGAGTASAGSKDGSSLTVAWGSHLFGVSPGFALAHVAQPFMADGSGYAYAYGSLYATERRRMGVEVRARLAVEAAICFCTGCGGQVRIVATEPEAA